MDSKIQRSTDKCVFRCRQSIVRRILPAYDYCRALFSCLNCAQRSIWLLLSTVAGSWEELPNIWLTVATNALVGWDLNFRVRILLKDAVMTQTNQIHEEFVSQSQVYEKYSDQRKIRMSTHHLKGSSYTSVKFAFRGGDKNWNNKIQEELFRRFAKKHNNRKIPHTIHISTREIKQIHLDSHISLNSQLRLGAKYLNSRARYVL